MTPLPMPEMTPPLTTMNLVMLAKRTEGEWKLKRCALPSGVEERGKGPAAFAGKRFGSRDVPRTSLNYPDLLPRGLACSSVANSSKKLRPPATVHNSYRPRGAEQPRDVKAEVARRVAIPVGAEELFDVTRRTTFRSGRCVACFGRDGRRVSRRLHKAASWPVVRAGHGVIRGKRRIRRSRTLVRI